MRNVVAYCRVSGDVRAREENLEIRAQKEQIMAYCARNEMQISGWYVDDGEPVDEEGVSEFDRLVYGDEVKGPPVEAVIVAKSDRVSRDINEYYYYRYELLRKNVGLISVMEDFGRLGVFGQALEALVFTMVKMERERVAKHTKSGRVAKAAKGGYSGGRPPFGYRPVNGVLTIVPEEAEAVKKIFEMKKDGFTHKEICEVLNAEGKTNRSGGRFSASTICTILANENTYLGYYRYGKSGEWVKGEQDPILTES